MEEENINEENARNCLENSDHHRVLARLRLNKVSERIMNTESYIKLKSIFITQEIKDTSLKIVQNFRNMNALLMYIYVDSESTEAYQESVDKLNKIETDENNLMSNLEEIMRKELDIESSIKGI